MCSIEGLPAVVAAAREVAAQSPTTLPDDEVTHLLEGVLAAINLLEAVACSLVGAVHARGLGQSDGSASTQAWLSRRTGMGRREAHRRVRTAVALRELSQTHQAWLKGDLWRGHAEAVALAADSFGTAAVAAGEVELLAAATQVDSERLAASLRNARHLRDPVRHASDARAGHAARRFHLSPTFEGWYRLDGVLDSESGALVGAAVAALSVPQADVGGADSRTPAQRRADALVELCRRNLDSGLPEQAGERPHVTVLVPLEVLEARVAHGHAAKTEGGQAQGGQAEGGQAEGGQAADDACRRPAAAKCDGVHRRATIDGAGTVPTSEQIRRLLCDAQISRVITGPASLPLDVGRSARTVTPAQRRALRVRDGCCRFPGCDRAFAWTDAHHVVHWANGGPTDLDNLVSLCRLHHRACHEGRWSLRAAGRGRFEWTDPSGARVAERRPGADSLDAGLALALAWP